MPENDIASARPLQEQLVGAWELVSYEARSDNDEQTVHPMGDDASGYVMYTPDGHVSVQIMRPGRVPYQVAGPGEGTAAERAEAAGGYLAYSGSYRVVDNSVVVHEIDVSLLPNWVGESLRRKVTLDGPRLELTTITPIVIDGRPHTAVLTWDRAEASGARNGGGVRASGKR
ncbi:lipocalin-like domain-containing protein [Pseudonocardia sp. CA-142604]|uniref:lipocalin-like domain-containing protein n=1 Tax=Pseudonocardia sp. CA-142604 TaxID=3240024 RepID=UPI003D8E2D4C